MAQMLGFLFACSVLFSGAAGAYCTETTLSGCGDQSTCEALTATQAFSDGTKASWIAFNPAWSSRQLCNKCGIDDNILNCGSKALCEGVTGFDKKNGKGVGSWKDNKCGICGDCINASNNATIPDCNPFAGCTQATCDTLKWDDGSFGNWKLEARKSDGYMISVCRKCGKNNLKDCSETSCKSIKLAEKDMITTFKGSCSTCNKSEPSQCAQATCANLTFPDGSIPNWKEQSCQKCSLASVISLHRCNQTTCANLKVANGSTTWVENNRCAVCGDKDQGSNSLEGCNTKDLCDKAIFSDGTLVVWTENRCRNRSTPTQPPTTKAATSTAPKSTTTIKITKAPNTATVSGSTGSTGSTAPAKVISMKLTIAGMDYSKVSANATAVTKLKKDIKDPVVEGLGAGYTADHVKVTLSAGSVKANVEITALADADTTALTATVKAFKDDVAAKTEVSAKAIALANPTFVEEGKTVGVTAADPVVADAVVVSTPASNATTSKGTTSSAFGRNVAMLVSPLLAALATFVA